MAIKSHVALRTLLTNVRPSVVLEGKTEGLGVADKAASLMGCESPTANCPIRAVSISDVWRGNELYDARK